MRIVPTAKVQQVIRFRQDWAIRCCPRPAPLPAGAAQESPVSGFFHPASAIVIKGRPLRPGRFSELAAQLRGNEALCGLYRREHGTLIAAHLHSETWMRDVERLYGPCEGYWAFPL